MILLSVYAAVFWWAAYAARRTWKGAAVALAAGAFVLPAVDPFVYLLWWAIGEKPAWIFPFLYAYAALVTLVALFLAALPRVPRPLRPCLACGYELVGSPLGACPECGKAFIPPSPPGAATARRTPSAPLQAPRPHTPPTQ